MSGSTITTTIKNTVTVGSGAYITPLTISSSGAVTASTANDVGILMPGSVTGSVVNFGNVTGGLDTNNYFNSGVGVQMAGGTFINDGHVAGGAEATGGVYGGIGVYMTGGVFDNASSGTVAVGSGNLAYAVDIAGGTFINAGTLDISGNATYAVVFGDVNHGAAANVGTLVADPGAVFNGKVSASTNLADVLEFGATGSVGTLTGIGTQFLNFAHLSFATGASFDVSGTVTAFDAKQTITGFAAGDALTLDGFTEKSASFVSGTGLELTGTAGNKITLDLTGAFTTADFKITPSGANTTISLVQPCFAQGTKILTTHGEIPVEQLSPGDVVLLHNGEHATINWIGHRSLTPASHPSPEKIMPVLIMAGALGDGLPSRDLYLSPDHALYLDAHLIPAKALINGVTIRQVARHKITYYHVELTTHAVLLAEGVPAESYLETGNRNAFTNSNEPLNLHPDFARSLRAAGSCAPLVESGPIVEAVRRSLLARFPADTTNDPALTLQSRPDGSLIIASRSAIPGHLNADPRDQRQLGVKIVSITRTDGTAITLDHPDLVEGWHMLEPDGRWTNGAAIIPATLLNGQTVHLTTAATLPYRIAPQNRIAV